MPAFDPNTTSMRLRDLGAFERALGAPVFDRATLRYMSHPRVGASRRGIIDVSATSMGTLLDVALDDGDAARALAVVRRYLSGRLHAVRAPTLWLAFATSAYVTVVVRLDDGHANTILAIGSAATANTIALEYARDSAPRVQVSAGDANRLLMQLALVFDALPSAQPTDEQLDALLYEALVDASLTTSLFIDTMTQALPPAEWRAADADARRRPDELIGSRAPTLAARLAHLYERGRLPDEFGQSLDATLLEE